MVKKGEENNKQFQVGVNTSRDAGSIGGDTSYLMYFERKLVKTMYKNLIWGETI